MRVAGQCAVVLLVTFLILGIAVALIDEGDTRLSTGSRSVASMERVSAPEPNSGCNDPDKIRFYLSQTDNYLIQVADATDEANTYLNRLARWPKQLDKPHWQDGMRSALFDLRRGANGLRNVGAPGEISELESIYDDAADAMLNSAQNARAVSMNGDLGQLDSGYARDVVFHLTRAEIEVNGIALACGF